MSGHTHTYTQDNYSNSRCACAPRVKTRPKSVFTCTQCASDSEEINEPSYFEHACEQHSDLIGDLTCSSLIDCLIKTNSDSIFNSCMYMSNCTSLWSFVF